MANIIVTGAAGWTARAIVAKLTQLNHRIIGVDIHPPQNPNTGSPFTQWLPADISDPATIQKICEVESQIDAIVHLAVAVGENDYASSTQPFKTNVQGTYNIYRVAQLCADHQQAPPQLILMSSASVHLPPEQWPNTDTAHLWTSHPEDDHLYDLTKRLQEHIALDFAETFGVPTTILRAGHIVDGRAHVDPHERPLRAVTYCRGGWVCRYDLAEAVAAAVQLNPALAAEPPIATLNWIGAQPAYSLFDVPQAEHLLKISIHERFDAYSSRQQSST